MVENDGSIVLRTSTRRLSTVCLPGTVFGQALGLGVHGTEELSNFPGTNVDNRSSERCETEDGSRCPDHGRRPALPQAMTCQGKRHGVRRVSVLRSEVEDARVCQRRRLS